MAQILICEPHREIRELLGHVVVRLGHEPVYAGPDGAGHADVDAVLLEPAHAPSRKAVAELRSRRTNLPVVCTSIHPPNGELAELEPFAYLLKPFSLEDLEDALARALVGAPLKAA